MVLEEPDVVIWVGILKGRTPAPRISGVWMISGHDSYSLISEREAGRSELASMPFELFSSYSDWCQMSKRMI